MIVPYFSIYDHKAMLFAQVFPAPTPGAAERSLKDAMANPDSPIGKYPEDYALFRVFDFDDSSGVIVEKYEPPQLVVQASSIT